VINFIIIANYLTFQIWTSLDQQENGGIALSPTREVILQSHTEQGKALQRYPRMLAVFNKSQLL
jgi:hypothetical protein